MNTMDKILSNVVGVVLLIMFISIMYQKRYTRQANEYIENQLALLGAGSIGCIIILYTYYNIEKWLHIDEQYLKGICLAAFLGIGGILINKLYNSYFLSKSSRYKPSNEEYLFIITVSFVGSMIKLLFDGMIGFSIPISLLLGRFLWLDTRDIHAITKSIKVNHNRIKETASLFLIGMALISFLGRYLKNNIIANVVVSFVFGFILYFPYNFIITKLSEGSAK